MSIISYAKKKYAIREDWLGSVPSYDLQVAQASQFAIETEGDINVTRYTVSSGDQYSGTSGERAEIILGGYSNSFDFLITGLETETEYYRFKVKLASPWIRPSVNGGGYRWGMCFQVHGPNSFAASPALAVHCEDVFGLFLYGGEVDGVSGALIPMTNNALVLDAWVDLVVEVKWSATADGHAALYRKDAGASGFSLMGQSLNRATLQWVGTAKNHQHYIKTGFYRSESAHSNTVRIGPILRTTDAAAAFA